MGWARLMVWLMGVSERAERPIFVATACQVSWSLAQDEHAGARGNGGDRRRSWAGTSAPRSPARSSAC